MRKSLVILLLVITGNVSSQEKLVNLSEINFSKLSLEDLRKMDPDIKLVALEQKDFCADNNTEDGSSEIKFGYKSKLFPGVRFYEPKNDENLIPKIHLTREFIGYLPDGKFVDIKTLSVPRAIEMYGSQFILTPNKCNNYYELIKDEYQDFILKIYKANKRINEGEQRMYEKQLVQGIDIVFERVIDSRDEKNEPLYIVEGKETKEEEVLGLNPDKIKSVTVLNDKNAEIKYGKKGKNGVVEVKLKK